MDTTLQIIEPRTSDLGDGFAVRRALPHAVRRHVGPFVFFDEMGPAAFDAGQGLDVRPHPHIGLATVTWLFEGEIEHRDSLGTVVAIRPGEVNWMRAGTGIVHSERTPRALRGAPSRLWGVQTWVALPLADEASAPAFAHQHDLPRSDAGGVALRIVAGTALGLRSPVGLATPMFQLEARFAAGSRLVLDDEHAERAAYVAAGAIEVDGRRVEAGRLAVFAPGAVTLSAAGDDARVVLFGGAPLDAPRFVWWNFVASTRERIEDAKARWQAQAFAPVPGETEFIPLPGPRPAPPVSYP